MNELRYSKPESLRRNRETWWHVRQVLARTGRLVSWLIMRARRCHNLDSSQDWSASITYSRSMQRKSCHLSRSLVRHRRALNVQNVTRGRLPTASLSALNDESSASDSLYVAYSHPLTEGAQSAGTVFLIRRLAGSYSN